jgi:acyl-CoA thioesterase
MMNEMPHQTIHSFDQATAVERKGSAWLGRTCDLYWAFVGPFGGTTAATLLRAVLLQAGDGADPVAISVNFCAPIARGDFTLDVQILRINKSSQHWTSVLRQNEEVAAFATIVLAQRKDSWSRQELAMPRVKRFGELDAYQAPTTVFWVRQYEFRFASGALDVTQPPSETHGDTRSNVWIADRSRRQIDVYSLAAMSDAFFGRIFHALGKIVPFGTVSMTTYFHVGMKDLQFESADIVLGAAWAKNFHLSYGDQVGALWAPSGKLLATTQQLAYFKA